MNSMRPYYFSSAWGQPKWGPGSGEERASGVGRSARSDNSTNGWETIVGIATATLCFLRLALRNLYHAYWTAKKATCPLDWNTLIRSDDAGAREIALKLLCNSSIQECSYKIIFIKRSAEGTTDPMFSDDGVLRTLQIKEDDYKANEVLLIVLPVDKIRSEKLLSCPQSVVENVTNGIKENGNKIPLDIHVKILSYDDWHDWCGSYRLSQRAIECFATDKHNINISKP